MRSTSRTRLSILLLLLAAIACHKQRIPLLTLEECDPAGYIGCIQPSSFLSLPIADTNLSLTYSSRWADHKLEPGSWDAQPLGLGGWSINLVQRYDPQNHILIGGDGTWRRADAVKLPSAELAVPSYDDALAYIFDSAGRHIRTVDGHLGMELVKISYDKAGRLSQVDGSAGGKPVHLGVRRDPMGIPRVLLGIDGASTALEVDGNGHLTALLDPAEAETHISWNANGLVESATDPGGDIQKFSYDSAGYLASETDPDGVTRHYDRNESSDALEIKVSTALGRTNVYRSESVKDGIRRTLIRPDGTQSSQTTDAQGNRTLNLADGTSWTIGALVNPVWAKASPILTPVVETRPDGVSSRREVTWSLHPQQQLPYTVSGTSVITINGQNWTETFDPAQRTAVVADPAGRRTESHYDEHGRLLTYSAPGRALASYAYGAKGRLASATIGTGGFAHTLRYAYDSTNGQITTTREDGAVQKIQVDHAGRIVSASEADGSTAIFGYDAAGRMNQVQPPGGTNFTVGLSPAGRATAFVPPMVKDDASVEISSYNTDGRLTSVSGLGNRAISYEYDSAGRIVRTIFDQGKRTFSYDSHSGLTMQSSDPSGVNTAYVYLGARPTGLTWSGAVAGSVSVRLDADGRPMRESVDGREDLNLTYDRAGNLTALGPLSLTRDPATGLVTRSSMGVVENRQSSDNDGLLIQSTTMANGRIVFDQRYTRDALGRIKSIRETSADEKPVLTEFSYDGSDRLASVKINGHPAETYKYDPAGDRIAETRAAQTLKASYDDRDRLLEVGSSQYKWMPDGTLAGVAQGQRATAFVYDDFGALREASLPDRGKIRYLVDAEGRRIGREIAGKLVSGYLYNLNGSIAAETDGAGKIISRFAHDDLGHLALLERNGTMYRVITDTLGSPRMVIDSKSGEIADEIAYDAWGNVTREKSPGFLCIGFSGGLRDPDTGLIRFGARDYDPAIGRWTAPDPIRFNGGDPNLYRYSAGDPVNARDPSGLWCERGGIPELGIFVVCTPSSGEQNSVGFHHDPASDSWSCAFGVYCGGLPWNGSCIFAHCSNGTNGFNCIGILCHAPDDPIENTCFFCSLWKRADPGGSGPGGGGPGGGGPGGGGPGGGGPGGGGPGGGGPGGGGPGGGGPGGGGPGGGGPGGGGPGGGGPGGGGPGGGGPGHGPGGGNGEPHLHTIAGLHFDFQAVGEFLVAASRNGKYVIQSRQEPYFTGAPVTINTAIAANVNGDRIGVYVNESSFLLVNNAPAIESDLARSLPRGGRLQRHGGNVVVTWPDGGQLTVTRVANSLDYTFEPSPAETTDLTGLLGVAKHSPDQIPSRAGGSLPISDADFANKLYKQVGNSWRIKQSESLFHYWHGESTANFTDQNFPPKYVSISSLSSAERSKAEMICRAVGVRTQPLLDDCIFDVGATGLPAFAAASIGIHLASLRGTALASSYGSSAAPATAAPTAPAPGEYSINIGDTVSPNHPSEGAGILSKPGQKQSYSFHGDAGENIFVAGGACDGAVPNFELRQSDDKSLGGVTGCGGFGPITLPAAGNYHILVTALGPSAHYSFTVRPTSFDQFSIKVGDAISPDHPAKAGIIKELGQRQSYSFAGRAAEVIYVALGPCEDAQPSFDLLKPDNSLLANVIGNCNADIGRQTLPIDGTYRIVASTHQSHVNSRYSFSLRPTPPDLHFSVRLPLTVKPSAPAGGAGRISAMYEQQFYDFSANAGTLVHIEGHCSGSCTDRAGTPLQIRATKAGEASGSGFSGLAFTKGEWTLPAGGQYTIQVRSNGYTGDYSFIASFAAQH